MSPRSLLQCTECAFITSQKSRLRRHLVDAHKIDYGEDYQYSTKRVRGVWHRCEFCPYKTVYRCNITQHVISRHTALEDIAWHCCKHCDYKSKHSYQLHKHVVFRHTDSKQIQWHKCHKCSYKAKKNFLLIRHKKLNHLAPDKIKWYPCKYCEYKSKYNSSLIRHVGRKHPKKLDDHKKGKKSRMKKDKNEVLEKQKRPSSSFEMNRCPHCLYEALDQRSINIHITRSHVQVEQETDDDSSPEVAEKNTERLRGTRRSARVAAKKTAAEKSRRKKHVTGEEEELSSGESHESVEETQSDRQCTPSDRVSEKSRTVGNPKKTTKELCPSRKKKNSPLKRVLKSVDHSLDYLRSLCVDIVKEFAEEQARSFQNNNSLAQNDTFTEECQEGTDQQTNSCETMDHTHESERPISQKGSCDNRTKGKNKIERRTIPERPVSHIEKTRHQFASRDQRIKGTVERRVRQDDTSSTVRERIQDQNGSRQVVEQAIKQNNQTRMNAGLSESPSKSSGKTRNKSDIEWRPRQEHSSNVEKTHQHTANHKTTKRPVERQSRLFQDNICSQKNTVEETHNQLASNDKTTKRIVEKQTRQFQDDTIVAQRDVVIDKSRDARADETTDKKSGLHSRHPPSSERLECPYCPYETYVLESLCNHVSERHTSSGETRRNDDIEWRPTPEQSSFVEETHHQHTSNDKTTQGVVERHTRLFQGDTSFTQRNTVEDERALEKSMRKKFRPHRRLSLNSECLECPYCSYKTCDPKRLCAHVSEKHVAEERVVQLNYSNQNQNASLKETTDRELADLYRSLRLQNELEAPLELHRVRSRSGRQKRKRICVCLTWRRRGYCPYRSVSESVDPFVCPYCSNPIEAVAGRGMFNRRGSFRKTGQSRNSLCVRDDLDFDGEQERSMDVEEESPARTGTVRVGVQLRCIDHSYLLKKNSRRTI